MTRDALIDLEAIANHLLEIDPDQLHVMRYPCYAPLEKTKGHEWSYVFFNESSVKFVTDERKRPRYKELVITSQEYRDAGGGRTTAELRFGRRDVPRPMRHQLDQLAQTLAAEMKRRYAAEREQHIAETYERINRWVRSHE